MPNFIITCDSSCDGDLFELRDKGISVLMMPYSDGNIIYKDDMNTANAVKFYENLRNGTVYKTSQVNPQEYHDFFKPLLRENKNIIHISLSSGLSNTTNSALIAKDMLEEEVEGAKVYIVDSKLASTNILILLFKLVEYRDQDMKAEEAFKKISDLCVHIHPLFTTDTLKYFARGGRLNKAEAAIGSILQINPILDVDTSGRLRVIEKARGQKRAFESIIKRIKYDVINPEEQYLYTNTACNEEVGKPFFERIVKEVGFKGYKYYTMGPIIGAHTGPGLIMVCFVGRPRIDQIIPISEIAEALENN